MRGETMKTKMLVLICWICNYAVIQTGDGVWLFFTVYSGILAVCAHFYSIENRKPKPKKSKSS